MATAPEIVVLDGYTLNPGDNPWDDLAALGRLRVYDRTPNEKIVERASMATIVLTNKTPLPAEVLAALPRLRFISVLATGVDVVDVEAAARQGIVVSNVPEYATDSVAQHTFALLLALVQHVASFDAAVKRGAWIASRDFCFWERPPLELAGRTMGIVGFGRIGRRVGEIAHAFGMAVLACARTPKPPLTGGPFEWVSVDEVFARADVVSLHCPLTTETERLVDRRRLGLMKPSAFLINTARGGLVDEGALSEALNEGRIAGAGLDVLAAEPMRPDCPLLGARNCVITPHVAWASVDARRRLMRMTVENVRAFLDGRPVRVVKAPTGPAADRCGS